MFNYESIPAPLRSIINVTVAGTAVVFVHDVDIAGGFTGINWTNTWHDVAYAALLGASTAVLRALNPADHAYGINAGQPVVVAGGLSARDTALAQDQATAVDVLPPAV